MPIEDYPVNLKLCAAVLIFTSSFAYTGDEARVRKLISQYDAAYSDRSVEKMEALLASEYQVVVGLRRFELQTAGGNLIATNLKQSRLISWR